MTTTSTERREFLLRTVDKLTNTQHEMAVAIPVVGGSEVRHIATASAAFEFEPSVFMDVEIVLSSGQWYTGLLPDKSIPYTYNIEDGEVPILNFNLWNFRLYGGDCHGVDWHYCSDGLWDALVLFIRDKCVLWNGKLLAATAGPPCLSACMYEDGPCISILPNPPERLMWSTLFSLWEHDEAAAYMKSRAEAREEFEGVHWRCIDDLSGITLHVAEPLPEWIPTPPQDDQDEDASGDIPF